MGGAGQSTGNTHRNHNHYHDHKSISTRTSRYSAVSCGAPCRPLRAPQQPRTYLVRPSRVLLNATHPAKNPLSCLQQSHPLPCLDNPGACSGATRVNPSTPTRGKNSPRGYVYNLHIVLNLLDSSKKRVLKDLMDVGVFLLRNGKRRFSTPKWEEAFFNSETGVFHRRTIILL